MLFKLPIEYVDSVELHKLRESIVDDLELTEHKTSYTYKDNNDHNTTEHVENTELELIEEEDKDNENQESDRDLSLFTSIFNPESEIERKYMKMHSLFTTSNKKYLESSQLLLDSMGEEEYKEKSSRVKVYDTVHHTWENIRHDEEFLEKYCFIDVEYFKFLNQSPVFLQILSIYNLTSPVLSFLMPVILLIIPFFIIKYNGIELSLTNYMKLVSDTLSKHPLGNLFNIFKEVPTETKVYSIVSILFYIFSMYQNTMICYRFHKNFEYIHTVLLSIKDYLNVTLQNMDTLQNKIKEDDNISYAYKLFDKDLTSVYGKCTELNMNLSSIEPLTFSSFTKVKNKAYEIGKIMKLFHDIHLNESVLDILEYSFQFNCYFENMLTLSNKLVESKMNKCELDCSNLTIEDMGHPTNSNMEETDIVTNNIDMKKNMIITGPNASGKTTILKGILLNVILTHQFGIGYFKKKTKMPIYTEIHCYLNIPDTSGRDSLFQAEARRCKEILDNIKEVDNELGGNPRHFCIFDELFSGTNPDEAITSSYGFIKYLINTNRIDFALTTHLSKLCEIMDKKKVKKIKNMKMDTHDVTVDEDKNQEEKSVSVVDFKYTYKMKEGISKVKGGLKVLKDLNYPSSILRLF